MTNRQMSDKFREKAIYFLDFCEDNQLDPDEYVNELQLLLCGMYTKGKEEERERCLALFKTVKNGEEASYNKTCQLCYEAVSKAVEEE